MKAMKAMKKKVVSKIGKGRFAKAMVLHGAKAKTSSGLTANDLTKNKFGKIVSKKKSAQSKKRFKAVLGPWNQAVQNTKRRRSMNIDFDCTSLLTPIAKTAKLQRAGRRRSARGRGDIYTTLIHPCTNGVTG